MNEEEMTQEEEVGVIELVDEDGTSEKFTHLATIEYEGKTYGVFSLAEPKNEEEEGMGFVFSMEEDGDAVIFEEVEDDDIADAVFNRYLEESEEYEA